MEHLQIGKVASLTGVGIETIRFYEREGLVKNPPRTPSGYRKYPPEVVKQIRFIKRAQNLGFSLKEIRELMTLRVSSDKTCEKVKNRSKKKIADIRQKIRSLKKMEKALVKLTTACKNRKKTSQCPILDSLDADE